MKLEFRPWMRISQRIFAGFLVNLVCALVLGAVNILNMGSISSATTKITTYNEYLGELNTFQYICDKLEATSGYVKRDLLGGKTIGDKDNNTLTVYSTQIQTDGESISTIIKKLAPEEWARFDELLRDFSKNQKNWAEEKSYASAALLSGSMTRLTAFTNSVIRALEASIESEIRRASGRIRVTRNVTFVFTALLLGVVLITALPMLRELKGLFTPVREASETALTAATRASDYATEMDGSIAQLKAVLSDIGRAIEEVTNSAQDSSTQAATIIAAVKDASEFAGALADEALAIHERLNANQGYLRAKVAQVQELSSNIASSLARIIKNADRAENLAGQVTALKDEIRGIETFLAFMDEINDQTELLALNASVEAARAGDQAMGFAVVAERLRKLSDETKRFTNQIQQTTLGIQDVSREVAAALSEIIASVRGSANEVLEVNQEFAQLKQVLESLYEANESVIHASSHQLEKTRQIHQSATDIRRSIEEISVQTEQVSGAMEELSAESQEIVGQIELISGNVGETRAVIERQVELARLAKDAADRF
ncbi:MAG: methyl-accepting chemotaxis protein [Bacteroidota bacterium]